MPYKMRDRGMDCVSTMENNNNNGILLSFLCSYLLYSWSLRNQFPQPQISEELETAGLNTTSCQEKAINRIFKTKFQNISGAKGYSKEWIKEEIIYPPSENSKYLFIIHGTRTCHIFGLGGVS